MADKPDATLSRFTAILNELVGAAMVTGAKPDNREAAQEVTRLKAELKGMYPQWLPIESAPKNGTRIIVFYPDAYGSRRISLRSWQRGVWGSKEQECWADEFMQKREDEPTLWMPSPEEPKS